jgi:acetylornithine deacetylase
MNRPQGRPPVLQGKRRSNPYHGWESEARPAMPLSNAEQKAVEYLSNRREELMEFVAAGIRTPSVTGTEGPFGEMVASWLKDNDFESRMDMIGEEFGRAQEGFNAEHDLGERPNVYAWLRGADSAAPPLVLCTHLDVVSTGDRSQWLEDPFSGSRSKGRILGRGATDMKGSLSAALYAMRAVRQAGLTPACDVQFQAVSAEESGGLGTLRAISTERAPSAVIVTEPTGGAVSPACSGCVHFTTTVTGLAGHAAVPWTAVSALDKMILVYDALKELARKRQEARQNPLFADYRDAAPFSVGVFNAGEWRSTVPDRAQFIARFGVMPDESIAEVRAQIVDAVSAAATTDKWLAEHPPVVSWDNAGFPGWETDATSSIVRIMSSASEAVTGSAKLSGVTYGSDAGHYASSGIPTVQFGAGRISGAHGPNEYVEEGEVLMVAQALAVSIARYRP